MVFASVRELVAFASLLLLATTLLAQTAGKPHPVPVSEKEAEDAAFCATCHQVDQGKTVHAALQMGCQTCHEFRGSGEQTQVALKAQVPELCVQCHEDAGKAMAVRKVHPALQKLGCVGCHSPHASEQPKLLRESQQQLCAGCHGRNISRFQHKPYADGQCSVCHQPHGNDAKGYLRTDADQLCRGCHKAGEPGVTVLADEHKVRLPWKVEIPEEEYQHSSKLMLDANRETGHPLVGHPMSGFNTRYAPASLAEFGCTSCHQSHASEMGKLMPSGLARDIDLCDRCHR